MDIVGRVEYEEGFFVMRKIIAERYASDKVSQIGKRRLIATVRD